jgi:hypothetical protein
MSVKNRVGRITSPSKASVEVAVSRRGVAIHERDYMPCGARRHDVLTGVSALLCGACAELAVTPSRSGHGLVMCDQDPA